MTLLMAPLPSLTVDNVDPAPASDDLLGLSRGVPRIHQPPVTDLERLINGHHLPIGGPVTHPHPIVLATTPPFERPRPDSGCINDLLGDHPGRLSDHHPFGPGRPTTPPHPHSILPSSSPLILRATIGPTKRISDRTNQYPQLGNQNIPSQRPEPVSSHQTIHPPSPVRLQQPQPIRTWSYPTCPRIRDALLCPIM
jgi:hypothetical protein